MATDLQNTGLREDIDGTGLRIGIVWSQFNRHISEGLLNACLAQLQKSHVDSEDIEIFSVPGALEIPMMIHEMILTDKFDCVIALGCIIRGETYHFEVVANESARCLSDIQIGTGVPVANAILTTENEQQALDRMTIKGAEAAQVVIEMALNLKRLHA